MRRAVFEMSGSLIGIVLLCGIGPLAFHLKLHFLFKIESFYSQTHLVGTSFRVYKADPEGNPEITAGLILEKRP
jgi:hypothetical protein